MTLVGAMAVVAATGASPADAPADAPANAPVNAPAQSIAGAALLPAPAAGPDHCLSSRDGYLRAHLAGAVEARVDWGDPGTRCEGDPKDTPPGVRLSFHRIQGRGSNLLFVFGLSGVREGRPAKEVGANLTLFVQGTDRVYGTLGDSRCTVDSLRQTPLAAPRTFRVEARGFCTQPAHAVRGDGAVLVSTFEFAGLVDYDPRDQ